MAVPIHLVTGFLGSGKTTAINHMLTHSHGRRIAAVVNDFGQINIDAELIAAVTDDVISLSNGCICCSLEGELIRTVSNILKRDPKPEMIVIETSGVANPGDIVRSLMDPFIWQEAPLEQVLCLVDGSLPLEDLSDPLKQSQLQAADLVAVTKLDLAGAGQLEKITEGVKAISPVKSVIAAPHGRIQSELLLPIDLEQPKTEPRVPKQSATGDRFETRIWTSDQPLSMPRFRQTIERLAPILLRAKGMVAFDQVGESSMVFQLSGGRATLAPRRKSTPPLTKDAVRMVFIAEKGELSRINLDALMDACVAG
ncbi:GTP-binding protein [Salipiger sp. H15]|uniref:GTP-binding protein n=1 Tax=Alloyangia sp. H15 TaxID=3029062 RepID=A0AAU8ALC8_9RHOB